MTIDELIQAFRRLEQDDSEMRIDYTRLGDGAPLVRVVSISGHPTRMFRALAADAAAIYYPVGTSDPLRRWLLFVVEHAPGVLEVSPTPNTGIALRADEGGSRTCVAHVSKTIPNAAGASALVASRCSETVARRQESVALAVNRFTIGESLVWLARRGDVRWFAEPRDDGVDHAEDEPLGYALTWVHGRCAWSTSRNGTELWDYVGQAARGDIVDTEVRELVVPQLRDTDSVEARRALWTEVLTLYPFVGDSLLDSAAAASVLAPHDEETSPPVRRGPNPTERAVIDLLYKRGVTGVDALRKIPLKERPTGERLAQPAIARCCDSQFKATLAHMVDLRWIDNGKHHKAGPGYFLTQAGVKLVTVNRQSGPSQD